MKKINTIMFSLEYLIKYPHMYERIPKILLDILIEKQYYKLDSFEVTDKGKEILQIYKEVNGIK